MTTSCVRWMRLGAAGFVALSLVSAVSAKDELRKAVRSVLADESRPGRYESNRRQRLVAELVTAKNSDEELHWQAGFVKVNGKWLPFEESLSPEPSSGNGREYIERREKAEHTWQSQSALASWCSQHQLSEQSQAHNYHSLFLCPRTRTSAGTINAWVTSVSARNGSAARRRSKLDAISSSTSNNSNRGRRPLIVSAMILKPGVSRRHRDETI